MTAPQPVTADELATIRARAYVDRWTPLARDVLRLVAAVEQLQAIVDDATSSDSVFDRLNKLDAP